MFRKILIGGVTIAAIVGAGTTALAVSGSDTTSGTASGSSGTTQKHAGKQARKGGKKLLRHTVHGEFVTHGKSGFVTHELIRGTVSAVSASSITVQALDKKSETFSVSKDTKVRSRSNGKATTSTIAEVATGDRVLVAGTGAGTPVAKHVIDRGTK